MKEKIIETAGKAWQVLGQNGESEIQQLPRLLKEKDGIVFQALGWLAREDKINYITKNNKTFVSLVEGELQAFKNAINAQTGEQPQENRAQTKRMIL